MKSIIELGDIATNNDVLQWIITGLEGRAAAIGREIESLNAKLSGKSAKARKPDKSRKVRKLSAKGLAAIRAAQKRRWAEAKKAA